jgi:phenylacetate-CoA ligase
MIYSYYNRDLETLEHSRLRDIQFERLAALIRQLPTSEFYREKLEQASLDQKTRWELETLRQVPFTTKAELVAEQSAYPPFGRLLTNPAGTYTHLHQTSGTTGQPLRWLDTPESWQWFTKCWGYVYRAAGVTADDVVFCPFSFGPYISHWSAMAGAWHIGALGISGGGMGSEQRLQMIFDNRCTLLVSTPTYALHLAQVARDRGIDLSLSPVRRSIHAGEPGASLPNVKRAIEEAWSTTTFDHAGATEVGPWAFDCEARTGAIHLNEAEFIFEVIDPKTLAPSLDGERGELVVTNLGRAPMPVIRYRTGDLVELNREACPCGRSFIRINGGVLGRTDDMLIVRGVNLYPSAIDDLIRSIPEVREYQVSIRRLQGMDDLFFQVEAGPGAMPDHVSEMVVSACRRRFNIRVSVESVPAGSLPRYEFKARRFKRVSDD